MADRLYKFLTDEGRGRHSGSPWPLPTADAPGEWVRVEGALIACENGLHLARSQNVTSWLDETAYEAEYRGERIDVDGDQGKVVVREARLVRRLTAWDDRAMRLFACDCAERVLPIYERDYPGDTRPRNAIAVARRFANGAATRKELAAAWAAASAAASAAARAAAWDAAWDAERSWQAQRFLAYIDGTVQPLTAADLIVPPEVAK